MSRETDLTQRAIEVMTAWASSPDDHVVAEDFVIERLGSLVADTDDAFGGAVDLIIGLMNLNGVLLMTRAEEVGADASATLHGIALKLARDAT